MIKQILIGLFLIGFATSAMAHGGSHQAGWVDVGGNVHFGELPVCALVLINGQTQFSCDGTGRYDMQVPVDDNGMITVQVYADGFAPYNQIVTPEQAAAFPVDILLDQNSPTLEVVATYEPSATEGRFVVSGTINIGAIPVCALVLANGQNMFSCNENFGQFSLDVPIDPDGNITLFVYAAGFKPFKIIASVLDSDGDGIRNYLDDDDDNDGVLDVDDECPLNPSPDCRVAITDSVFVDGKEWAQIDLFANLSPFDIRAVCPTELCDGVLNGFDVTGWTWASRPEVESLFRFFTPSTNDCTGMDRYMEAGFRTWLSGFNLGTWGWTSDTPEGLYSSGVASVSFPLDTGDNCNLDWYPVYYEGPLPPAPPLDWRYPTRGAWIYREA